MKPPARPVVPVSIQAAGEIRRLRVRLKTDADRLLEAAMALPAGLVADAAMKGTAGALRVWARILAAMPCPPTVLDYKRRVAVWRVSRPSEAMFARDTGGASSADKGVVLSALVVGKSRGGPTVQEVPWALTASDHSLARLLDRTGFAADPAQTLLEAHDALLCASRGCVETVLAERSWAIPAGPGAFIATFRGLRYQEQDTIVLASGGTWVSTEMLYPNQEAQVAALRFRQPGRTLRDGFLLPAPLRPAARPVADDQGEVAEFEL